jgi:hypothetical protein
LLQRPVINKCYKRQDKREERHAPFVNPMTAAQKTYAGEAHTKPISGMSI